MNTIRKWASALFLLAAACMTQAPDPRDIVADRARWDAVQRTTADGVLTQEEHDLLVVLIGEWDVALRVKEAAAAQSGNVLADMLRIYGVAAVQVILGPELQQRAPEVFRLVDKNSNGVLEEAELLGLDPASPVTAVVVITTLQKLLKR